MVRKRARPEIAAAADLGAYSVHLLVGEVRRHRVDERVDLSAFLGLGREVDVSGSLAAARPALIETLLGFVDIARAEGAATVTVVGTDPFRRARDAAEAIAEIRSTTGLEVAVLQHEEEALIALVGVQAGRPVLRETVVVDIGGGSTEVLVAGPSREPFAVGLLLGATRLTGMHVAHDPPTAQEVYALMSHARIAMSAAPDVSPAQLVAVGGTARSLLRVGPRLANRALTRRRIRRAMELLTGEPATEAAERHGIRLSRARVLVAGGAILLGALDHYGLDRVRVAKGGLREGLILAAHRTGPAWRTELSNLARGWDR